MIRPQVWGISNIYSEGEDLVKTQNTVEYGLNYWALSDL